MSERYVPAGSVASAFLDAHAPLGFFQAVGLAQSAAKFRVVEHGGARMAVVLEATRAEPFQMWELNEVATAWRGISLGPVQLEVDVNSAELSDHGFRNAGDITTNVDGVSIHVQVPRTHGTTEVRVGAGLPGPQTAPGHHFRNWRLSQRCGEELPVVLFERRGPTKG
jgi:hypothetical protein